MQYGYIRTEPNNQSRDEFVKELEPFQPAKVFVDSNLPGNEIQPELAKLLDILEPRDFIVTHACTTLSTDDVLFQKIIAKIRNKHCSVRFLDLSNHGLQNPIAKLRNLQSRR